MAEAIIGKLRKAKVLSSFQEYEAAMRAQQAWGRSAIAAQQHQKKVERARYGFEEVETGFRS